MAKQTNADEGLKLPKILACKVIELQYEGEYEEVKDREIKLCDTLYCK